MPRVTYNRLARKRSSVRKRRTSVAVRAKYAPKTAAVNRSLIRSNAASIRAVKRMIPPPVYCDFQFTKAFSPFLSDVPPGNYFNIQTAELMTPKSSGQPSQFLWQPCLRQDPNVLSASSTLVKRMQINLRYSLGQSNWCQISTFVVTLRKDAANRIVTQNGLSPDEDYVYNSQNYNPRLNSAVFKVHYVRHISLMSNAWEQPKAEVNNAEFAGNPNTTWAKGQVNINCNVRLRQPIGTPWVQMTQDQLSPNQRYYLVSFFKGQQNVDDVDGTAPRVDWDILYTTFNAS